MEEHRRSTGGMEGPSCRGGWRGSGRQQGQASPTPVFSSISTPIFSRKWVDPTCSAAQENEALRGEGTTRSADRAETSEPQPWPGGAGGPGSARLASCAAGDTLVQGRCSRSAPSCFPGLLVPLGGPPWEEGWQARWWGPGTFRPQAALICIQKACWAPRQVRGGGTVEW